MVDVEFLLLRMRVMEKRNICTMCEDGPRVKNQRWCQGCKNAWMRKKRAVSGYNVYCQSREQRVKTRNRTRSRMRRLRGPVLRYICSICGSDEQIEHHHPDHFGNPDLTVPMCRRHHRMIHESNGGKCGAGRFEQAG